MGNLLQDSKKFRIDSKGRTRAYFFLSEGGAITPRLLQDLREEAKALGNQDIRICLHLQPESNLHSMIVLAHLGSYYRPHMHPLKSETYHCIEGRAALCLFSSEGKLIGQQFLGVAQGRTQGLDDALVFRVDPGVYHVLVPLDPVVIVHESRPGPFLGNQENVFPSWAPDGSDPAAGVAWLKQLPGLALP